MKLLWKEDMRVNTVSHSIAIFSSRNLSNSMSTCRFTSTTCVELCGISRKQVLMVQYTIWLIKTTLVSTQVGITLITLYDTCLRYVDQCKINLILQEIFGIETGFHGKLLSGLARVRLPEVVNDANDKHMRPWSELCMVCVDRSLDACVVHLTYDRNLF